MGRYGAFVATRKDDIGLRFTQFANATCGTIRLRLLKVGALVTTSVRHVKIAMASAYPWRDEWSLLTPHSAQAAIADEPDRAQSGRPKSRQPPQAGMPHSPTSLKYHSREHCAWRRVQSIATGPFTHRSRGNFEKTGLATTVSPS